MPSQNMLPKGQRHHTVRPEYVATRGVEPEPPPVIPVVGRRVLGGRRDPILARPEPDDLSATSRMVGTVGSVDCAVGRWAFVWSVPVVLRPLW